MEVVKFRIFNYSKIQFTLKKKSLNDMCEIKHESINEQQLFDWEFISILRFYY